MIFHTEQRSRKRWQHIFIRVDTADADWTLSVPNANSRNYQYNV